MHAAVLPQFVQDVGCDRATGTSRPCSPLSDRPDRLQSRYAHHEQAAGACGLRRPWHPLAKRSVLP